MSLRRSFQIGNGTLNLLCKRLPMLSSRQLCTSTELSQTTADEYNEPEPLYPGYIHTTPLQRALLNIGSLTMCFLDPRRDDMISTFGEVSGMYALKYIHSVMMADPVGQRILREQPRIRSNTIDIDYLSQLPQDTFGKAYVNFLDRYNYSPDARRPVHFVPSAQLSYVMLRYRELHDLLHVVLGCGTDMLGEVTVKLVEARHTRLPLCISGAVMGSLRLKAKQRERYLTSYFPYALQASKSSKNYMCFYFEEHWETPIDEVRRQLMIGSPPSIGTSFAKMKTTN